MIIFLPRVRDWKNQVTPLPSSIRLCWTAGTKTRKKDLTSGILLKNITLYFINWRNKLGWAATDQNEHHNFVAFFELPIFLLAFCRFLSLFLDEKKGVLC